MTELEKWKYIIIEKALAISDGCYNCVHNLEDGCEIEDICKYYSNYEVGFDKLIKDFQLDVEMNIPVDITK